MNLSLADYLEENGFEKYEKARNYNEVQSLNDPKSDPFKSKYIARSILEEILSDIKKIKDQLMDEEDDLLDQTNMCRAFLLFHIGLNYLQTEERPTGEKHLKECIKIIKEENLALSQELVSVFISAHNELSLLWASREEDIKTYKETLDISKETYMQYRHEIDLSPFTVHELFTSPAYRLSDINRQANFEKIHTMTLFYLAQACKNLGEADKSAEYCTKTLRRQLESKEYEPKDWCLNAAGISQFYLQKNDFTQARHCLACASTIAQEIKEPELPEMNSEEDLSEEIARLKEVVPQTRADISRCWVKYCISLLETSRDFLQNDVGDMDQSKQQQLIQILDNNEQDESKNVQRMPLEVTGFEEDIRSSLAATFQHACDIFVVGKQHCDIALQFFVLDGFVTDHVEVQQDLSTLYKLIVFFEEELERKCRMHKRRIDLLNSTLSELSLQFYLVICQQLQFELAETYSDMLDLKVAIANRNQFRLSAHAYRKMNLLCTQAILYFTQFINTLKTPRSKLPDRFEDNIERAGVIAHFYLARLYSKILTASDEKKLENKRKSLGYYQFVVSYVEKNPEAKSILEKEYNISKEMTELIPASLSLQNH